MHRNTAIEIHVLVIQGLPSKYLLIYYIYMLLFMKTVQLINDSRQAYWCCWLGRPESLNTTLNTTIDSAMIEAQIEPQIIQTKLASQGQQMSEQQMLLQNSTDMAHAGCGSEKATEILNGWEGYVLVTVCMSPGNVQSFSYLSLQGILRNLICQLRFCFRLRNLTRKSTDNE